MLKIVHIGLESHYTDGLTYQDQMLVDQQCQDGHSVTYISDTQKFKDGELIDAKPGLEITDSGAKLLRLKTGESDNTFRPFLLLIRNYFSLKNTKTIGAWLISEKPDVIYCHHPHCLLLCYLHNYKSKFPSTKIYFDYHVDEFNTPKSKSPLNQTYHILYRFIYKLVLSRMYTKIDKIFYVWGGTKEYITKWYKIPESILEFYPLGGIIPDKDMYNHTRKRVRDSLNLQSNDILYIHTGKLSPEKRTEEIITAFNTISNEKIKLIILGSIPDTQKEKLLPLIDSNPKIKYLGWKTGSELRDYLCASDVYIQLGGSSATMQNALCCGCPVLLNSLNGYYNEFMRGNGMFVSNVDELINAMHLISTNPEILERLKNSTWKIAFELLDYRKLAARIYE